tara:strand:- start:330 stop:554 length:225 start_codon:yes stop_codon:yes gene_type:complete
MGGSASKEGGQGAESEEKVCTCDPVEGQHVSPCPLVQTGGRRRRRRKSRKRKSRNKRKKSRSKRRKRKRSRRRR